MDTSKALQVLEALASGCSPSTGELIEKESILNDRDVIRALQIAIDQLKVNTKTFADNIEIEQKDINEAINLFIQEGRSVSPSNLTGFFLSSRQFKNGNLISSKLYGKFRSIYTNGQLIDFFSRHLSENNLFKKNNFRDLPYRKIDFFQKEKFNKLNPNAINQLKEKVNELGILKTEGLSEYIQEARKIDKRAYEIWSEKEIELLSKALQYTNDLNLLSECFQRGKGSIESFGQKLIFKSENENNKNQQPT